uniref:Uncharacterized protein n=1 Tax=Opuntia streptacantha TaxID=393608 RepID=A0A7C9EA87_OPUST
MSTTPSKAISGKVSSTNTSNAAKSGCTNHSRRWDNHRSDPMEMNNRSFHSTFNTNIFNSTNLHQLERHLESLITVRLRILMSFRNIRARCHPKQSVPEG